MKKILSNSCDDSTQNNTPFYNIKILDLIGPFAFVLLIIFFAINNPLFLSSQNIFNIIRQSMPLLVVSVGATFIIINGNIDLSVDGVVTLSGITAVMIASQTFGTVWDGWASLIGALAVGILVGFINGFLVSQLRLPSFLVTLGISTICFGIGLIVTNGTAILVKSNMFKLFANGSVYGFPYLGFFSIAVLAIGFLLSKKTLFGRYGFAIGGNENSAILCGINTVKYKILTFMFAGAMSGLTGALMSSRLGAASNTMGNGMALDAIAAVVMGGTSLTGGRGGVVKTLLGVLIITMLSNGLNLMGVQTYTQILIKGIVVIVAVASTSDWKRKNIVK